MTKKKKYDIVVAGYLGIDLIPQFKNGRTYQHVGELFAPGKLTELAGMQIIPGGVVANTGVAMKRFEKKVFLNGIAGDDSIGRIVLEKLEEYELHEGIRTIANASTAFGIVVGAPGIDRIFLEYAGCNEIFGLKDIDFEAIAQSEIMHFGYPPLLKEFFVNDGRQLYDLFSTVDKMGVVTSLDLSLPDAGGHAGECDWLTIMNQVFPVTDIFVPSVEELLFIMMRPEYDRILQVAGDRDIIDFIPIELVKELGRKIVDLGVHILLIKMAHRGIYLITGDVAPIKNKGLRLDESSWNFTEMYCKAYPVDNDRYKNASGAGDTAVAAFLTAVINGYPPDICLKYAALAGRNNLYSNEIFHEIDDWAKMTHDLMSDENLQTVHHMAPVPLMSKKIDK